MHYGILNTVNILVIINVDVKDEANYIYKLFIYF